MMSEDLPAIEFVKDYYDIPFSSYGIFLYHPVTTEPELIMNHIGIVVDALKESGKNYVVVYPNNDPGSETILNQVKKLKGEEHFVVYPSIRFESFLTLLKNTEFIIGNSSAGIRESGIYGVPAIDIGTRQQGRYDIERLPNIQHVPEVKGEILEAIKRIDSYRIQCHDFGVGKGTEKFLEIIKSEKIWSNGVQKVFVDL